MFLASVALIIPGVGFLASYLISLGMTSKRKDSRSTKHGPRVTATSPKTSHGIPERYVVIRQISSSEFSSVHLAQDQVTGNRVLLKKITKPEILTNVKIPQAYGLAVPIAKFQDKDTQYEVLEYIEGWTLAEIIELNRSHVGVEGYLLHDWTEQLLKILVPLHNSHPAIVHRDINPSNILVRRESLELVLLDLSCAVAVSGSGEQIPVGRFGYTAPEQLQRRAVPASDLYSVGMVVYSMNLCKEPPTVTARQHRERDKLELRNVTLTTNLQSVFERLVALDPRQRFSDASEALATLNVPVTIKADYGNELWLPSKGKVAMGCLSWEYIRPDGTSLSHGFWFPSS